MERDFTVVSHSDSLGIGGAIRTGYYFFRDLHLDVIVQMDSDGEHPASHIMEMVRTLEERSLDVVIGSRYYNGITPQTSRLKITGVRTISNIFKILAPKYYVADIVSGFRVVRGDSLNKIHFVSDKNWAIEFLLRVVRSKLSIAEIAVPYRYSNHGESQFTSPKSYISYSINIFKQLIHSSRKIP